MERIETLRHQETPVGGLAMEIGIAGLVAGLVGASLMGVFLIIVTWWRDLGALSTFGAMSALFQKEGPVPTGGWAILLGMAVHGAFSVALGVLYAALVKPTTRPLPSVIGGMLLAVGVGVLMTAALLLVVDPTLRALALRFPTGWLGAHIAFGLCLGLVTQTRQTVAARAGPPGR